MDRNQKRRAAAIQKELLLVQKQEQKLERSALRAKPAGWKTALESKIPAKVCAGLDSTFSKGFSLVFQQGRGIIEKGIRKEDLQMDMLILKFIQGIPVIGILGGAANPVYYHKVMQYVKIKYRKRYLLGLSSQTKI